MDGAIFLRLFPKTRRILILFKAGKNDSGFQSYIIQTSNFFLNFPWILEFKVILKLLPEQIQNSSIFRTRGILGTLSNCPVKL